MKENGILRGTVRRGDIYYANLGLNQGSVISGDRPVLIVSNDYGNRYSTTVVVVPMTKKTHKKVLLPTHVVVDGGPGMDGSVILCEQVTTIDICQLRRWIGFHGEIQMRDVDRALMISMNLF